MATSHLTSHPRFALYLPPREGEVVPMYIGRARGIAVSKKPDLQVATELLEITGPLADYFHARGLRRLGRRRLLAQGLEVVSRNA